MAPSDYKDSRNNSVRVLIKGKGQSFELCIIIASCPPPDQIKAQRQKGLYDNFFF